VREAQVYCELFRYDAPADEVMALRPRGFILSGGPGSVYEPDAPRLPAYVLDSGLPSWHLLRHATPGPQPRRAGGPGRPAGVWLALLEVTDLGCLLFANVPFAQPVWMSHGDRIEALRRLFRRGPDRPFTHRGRWLTLAGGCMACSSTPRWCTPPRRAIIRNFLTHGCWLSGPGPQAALSPTA